MKILPTLKETIQNTPRQTTISLIIEAATIAGVDMDAGGWVLVYVHTLHINTMHANGLLHGLHFLFVPMRSIKLLSSRRMARRLSAKAAELAAGCALFTLIFKSLMPAVRILNDAALVRALNQSLTY